MTKNLNYTSNKKTSEQYSTYLFQGSNTLPRAGQLKKKTAVPPPTSLDDSQIVITKKLTGRSIFKARSDIYRLLCPSVHFNSSECPSHLRVLILKSSFYLSPTYTPTSPQSLIFFPLLHFSYI